MKRTALLALGLLLIGQVSLHAQEGMDLDRLVSRDGLFLHPQTLEPYSGPVSATWDSQGLRERGTLLDGRWHGVYEGYHENGRLSVRETFRRGELDGPSEAYFKNGRVSVKETYRGGELEGLYESYWSRGALAERGTWAAGRQCGEWVSFGRSVMYPPCPTDRAEP